MSTSVKSDCRKYPRVKAQAPISIAHADTTGLLGWSADFSLGGIRFNSPGFEIEVGELLRITLDLGGNHELSAVGKIMRIAQLDAFTQEVALAFVEVEAGSLALLQEHLEDLLEV